MQVSSIEYRVSIIDYRLSIIDYRLSIIEYRVSSIEYRVSSIEYRVSSIKHNSCVVRNRRNYGRYRPGSSCYYSGHAGGKWMEIPSKCLPRKIALPFAPDPTWPTKRGRSPAWRGRGIGVRRPCWADSRGRGRAPRPTAQRSARSARSAGSKQAAEAAVP